MAETSNIAKMASQISDDLFSEFFWTKVGPTDVNWPCEDPAHHGVTTHPADVVFYYDEPYSKRRTYVHCDLKSYAATSISPGAIRGAVESLAKQVACAEKSETWRKQYMHDTCTPDICGLLFVYNHDGEYDKSFASHLTSLKESQLPLPVGARLFVLGPRDIFWLDNVRYEIRQMRGATGTNCLPPASRCKYFYPQLDGLANVQPEIAKAATLEMLTSPWIVLEYQREKPSGGRGFIVFYRKSGETEEEFMYLLDYMRHYDMLRHNTHVEIKSMETSPTGAASFQKAAQRYLASFDQSASTTEFADIVLAIKYSKMTQVKSQFSTVDVGMDYA